MATIDDYLAYVSPEVEGCPKGIMTRELTAAAIMFCRRSHYIRKSVTISLIAGQRSYDVDCGANWDCLAALVVKYGGRELGLKGTDHLDYYYPGWTEHSGREPQICYLESSDAISVYPLPDTEVTGDIDVKAAVQPTRDSVVWYDDLYGDYVDCIAHGAKSKLMMMKGRDWYDPGQAGYCAAEFKRGYTDAKREVMKGFSNESLYVDTITMGQQ